MVRLDAVGPVIPDWLWYRRAGRMVGICKDRIDNGLVPGLSSHKQDELVILGLCQPDGTFIVTLADLRDRLAEMAVSGEPVCGDGLAVRVLRPGVGQPEGPVRRQTPHPYHPRGVGLHDPK